MQALWPAMQRQGATAYRSVTDSLAAVLKSKNSRSVETSMEVAHRLFDTTTLAFGNKATMDFFYREDNELADLLSHGPRAHAAFLQLLAHEGFDGAATCISEDTEYANIAHILDVYAADCARAQNTAGGGRRPQSDRQRSRRPAA